MVESVGVPRRNSLMSASESCCEGPGYGRFGGPVAGDLRLVHDLAQVVEVAGVQRLADGAEHRGDGVRGLLVRHAGEVLELHVGPVAVVERPAELLGGQAGRVALLVAHHVPSLRLTLLIGTSRATGGRSRA
jgi:hypothetical protein